MIMSTLFNVENMKCSGCSANVEKALADITGVETVLVDLEAKTVRVEGDMDPVKIAAIISTAGYPAEITSC